MTIEKKLDLLLGMARNGELDLGKTDEKTGFVNDQAIQQKIYGFHKPGTKEAIAADHEWEQLKEQLFEDKLLEQDYMDNWVLSLKGKRFRGYRRQRCWEGIQYYGKIIMNVFLTIAAVATIALTLLEYLKWSDSHNRAGHETYNQRVNKTEGQALSKDTTPLTPSTLK